MKYNVRIARELIRIANELVSQNEEQAIADAVAKINEAIMMDQERIASIGNGRTKSVVLGTLTILAFMFGFDSAVKAIQQSNIEREEKEAVENEVRWNIQEKVRNSPWFKDKRDEGLVYEDVLFSSMKMMPDENTFYNMVGRLNKKGNLDLLVFEGNSKSGLLEYPAIGMKMIKLNGPVNEPNERIIGIADDIILKKLLK